MAPDPPRSIAALGGIGPHVAVVRVVVAQVEGVGRQQDRIARDLEVVLEQVLRDATVAAGIGHEVVGVELVFLMLGHHLVARGLAEVVAALREGVAQHAVAVARPVERVRRGHAAVHVRVVVHDVDRLARVDEAAVLRAAAEEALAALLLHRLRGGVIGEAERLLLPHHGLLADLDGQLGRGLVQHDGGVARGDLERVARVLHGRLGMRVAAGGIGLRGDLGRMVLAARGGVFGELARGVHVVAEDTVLEEGDLALHAVVEGHVHHVILTRVDGRGLDGLQGTRVIGVGKVGCHERARDGECHGRGGEDAPHRPGALTVERVKIGHGVVLSNDGRSRRARIFPAAFGPIRQGVLGMGPRRSARNARGAGS